MKPLVQVLLLAIIPAALAAQGSIVGYLVARENGDPLAYGIVAVEAINRSAFTSDSGWFAFRDLQPGQHLLKVRRLGFTPRDISFVVRDGMTDTVRVELTRVAVRLGSVEVKSYPACAKPGAPSAAEDSALAAVVGQIRLNAEQYKFLADQYPYEYETVVSRSYKSRGSGAVLQDGRFAGRFVSSSQSHYRPGSVLQRRGNSYVFAIPTLVEIADKSFIDNHCWHLAGTETFEDETLIRVDAVAFDSLKNADVNGTFLISPNSFQIRKSTLHMSRRPSQIRELMDMEVTTEFFEVLPSIPIIAKVTSVQRMDTTRKVALEEAYESHVTHSFKWLKRNPADAKKTP